MEEQVIFSNLYDGQKDEVIFYSEADLPLNIINTDNLIVFDYKEDSSTSTLRNYDVQTLPKPVNEKSTTYEIPSTLKRKTKPIETIKKPAKHWCQKEVAIKTMESEFKVVIWALDDHEEEQKDTREQEPVVNMKEQETIKEERQEPALSEEDALPSGIKCTRKFCCKMFKSITKLRDHLRKHHATESNSMLPNALGFECTSKNCNKAFNNIASLRKHMHTHGPKTKICGECGKAFIDNSKLNRHLVVHTGDKPFQCTFAGCGKRFSLDFNLRTHARIHTGYKPFACTFEGCTKRFAQSTNLKTHRMIHLKKMDGMKPLGQS